MAAEKGETVRGGTVRRRRPAGGRGKTAAARQGAGHGVAGRGSGARGGPLQEQL